MSAIVVIGAQWGDEGKGKLVDYLTANADYVVRFQGGNNAGHTIVVNDQVTKLNLIPSGILHEDTICAIGAGCVVDPQVMLNELTQLKASGTAVSPQRIILDRDAHIILSYHRMLDAAREKDRGDNKIGTTGKGIGPAYEDRVTRCGVRFAELFNLPELEQKLAERIPKINTYLKEVLDCSEELHFDEVWQEVKAATELLPYIGNVSLTISKALETEKQIVFEGAQGTLLDQMHGTVPYVTSSNTIAGAVCSGVGLGAKSIDHTLGVAKAYCTRVGEGPFPTELANEQGDALREKGGEYGTVTGRPRRCGWLDAFALQRARRLNGIDAFAMTKLDVLSGIEKIKICINYYLDGEKLEDVPSLASELDRVEPGYIEIDGWEEDISQCKKWYELPTTARLYLATVSEILACPISMVSVGPDRNATIFSNSAGFEKKFSGIL